ncbi:MAG: ABC transporter ATP-binding protein [Candidatus Competibacteraceae bacterium]|nr:ABC transporter ATP-binding protein [Candidatus Competibacteraceae bacterium]MBK7982956.1 ABC transporter ATP-binding protein [Candidatus Competibacteraceae bacterium]MBK8898492.1 ABC transporter ATP-binding protein [Candidatus Competibacteraceae bacterium]MBK8962301.1 ABC transporter ATP-binding protein [Candidatus Competibacteraceae bacterium]MBK9951520.1 ABC transporter ATP-binding protein [Candidatus Competibacteraceae bacterium]
MTALPPPAPALPLLAVAGLEQSFGGVMALAGVSFQVLEGLIYAVIGPNGAGKTTLFNALCGFYQPSAGSIRFAGRELLGLSPHRIAACGVARTFQNLQLFFNMTVVENVMVGCHLRARASLFAAALRLPGMRRQERRLREWAIEALELCELADRAGQAASALPYGLMKRVEIARALAAKPRLLLLDEPAAGLNDTESWALRDLIARIRASGVTVLLVEHHMPLVMGVSDRLLVLDYGSVLAEGTPPEIQADPRVVAAYLGGAVSYAV